MEEEGKKMFPFRQEVVYTANAAFPPPPPPAGETGGGRGNSFFFGRKKSAFFFFPPLFPYPTNKGGMQNGSSV